MRSHGEYIPKEVIESIERTQRRPERAGDHPDRRRLFQHQRGAAQKVRAVRELPAHPKSAAHSHPLSRRRPDHRPRKHREPLLRPRARSRARRGGEPEDHHRKSFDPHCPFRFRIRPQEPAQENSRHPQSQHHEAVRRPVPALLPRCGQRTIPRSPTASTSWTTPACSW